MNLKPIKTAFQYAFGFAVAAGFVALLTFIFSFLGTIFCAALTGMMLGASRCRLWKSLLCSLAFPFILFTMMHFAKSELPGGRLVLLSFLCIVAFWLTYPGAAALLAMESKAKPGPAQAPLPAPQRQEDPDLATAQQQRPESAEVTLVQLQGLWSWEPTRGNSAAVRKTLEFAQDKLTLKVSRSDGGLCVSTTASVRVQPTHPATLVINAEHLAIADGI